MAQNKRIYRLNNFSGGENQLFPSVAMPSKFSTRMQNCHISDRGGIAKIPGYEKVNTDAVPETISTGFEFIKRDGITQIICAGGGKIFKVVGSALTSIKTGLNTSVKVWFTQMGDYCIMTNGIDTPMKYDGTTVSALGGLPTGSMFKKCHSHKGRVWAVDQLDKMTAFHSALNSPEDYTTAVNAGYIDFRFVLPRGDELVDICSFVDLIVFYFKQHIAIYSGTDPTTGGDFRIVQLIEGAGAMSQGVSTAIGTDLFCLNVTGVQSLRQVVSTGNLSVGGMSQPIQPSLKSEIVVNGGVMAMCHYPKLSWAMVLVGTRVFIYSYLHKAWGHMVGANITGMFNTVDGGLYMCGEGFLYRYGVDYSFAGSPMTMMWETGWINLSNGPNRFYPKIAEIICYPGRIGTIRLDLAYDFSTSMIENFLQFNTEQAPSLLDSAVTDTWDNSFYMDVGNYPLVRLPLFGGGKSMKMIFTNTSTDGPFEVNDITIQGVMGGM